MNMLRDLMNKIEIMQEQMVYVRGGNYEKLKEFPEIINTVREMKNTFKCFTSRLDTEESISNLESKSIETSNIEKQKRKQRQNKQGKQTKFRTEYPGNVITKGITCV